MDKMKKQMSKVLSLLIQIHKKGSASQCENEFHATLSDLLSLYKILEKRYCEKKELLDKISNLILLSKETFEDLNKNIEFIREAEEVLVYVESTKFDKIKVLFLPYKSSMWDSMESIYLAAKDNEDCQVDVMPIPYFNIDGNRDVISMEYEGELFPKELQIIDYKLYYIEDECPDVIFIHNPYDHYNFVTQIHPDYYSENLKKYTKHLCYTPYDIAIEETFNEDLCTMPGVQNAWRVFVQSETLKERYTKYNKEEKVVCLGSPKIDSIVNGDQYRERIPEEWFEKINGRQVFMLNTHLSRVIKADALDLEFFKKLINYMKKNRDIAVIWRPHPLIFQTIKSMNPMVLEAFEKLVEEFKILPNAIYDDTADMHMAIEISDAYFGDGGSLHTLYGATGKPIYWCGGANEGFEFDSSFSTARINEGESADWAFCKGHNGLYKVDYETKEASYELSLENENFYAKRLYTDVIEYKDWLYLLPENANDIVAVDRQTKNITVIKTSIGDRKYKYSSIIVKNNFLIVMPICDSDTMIIIDMDTQNVEELLLEDISVNSVNNLAYGIADIKDDTLYIPSRTQNKVLVYSKNGMYWQTIEDADGGFWQCKADEDRLWVLSSGGTCVYSCTYDFKEVSRVDYAETINNMNVFRNYSRFFARMITTKEEIWLLPLKAKFFLKINKETLGYEAIELSNQVIQKCLDSGKGYFGKSVCRDGNMYISSHGNAYFAIVDMKNGAMKVDSFDVKNSMVTEMHEQNKQKGMFVPMNKVIYMYTECSFEYFTQVVGKENNLVHEKRKRELLKGVENIDGSAGKKIWDYVYNSISE